MLFDHYQGNFSKWILYSLIWVFLSNSPDKCLLSQQSANSSTFQHLLSNYSTTLSRLIRKLQNSLILKILKSSLSLSLYFFYFSNKNDRYIQGTYRVFHRFRQAEFAYGCPILSSSQFLATDPSALKNEAHFKNGQIHSKKLIVLPQSKSVKLTVEVITWH